MRHKNGTNMAQTGGKSGTAAAASRGKVRNISNFCETCCGKFFSSRHNLAPNGPDLGEKTGEKSRLLRKTVEYSQLVTWKILFALSSIQYWIFRREAQTGDHFRSMAPKIYLNFSDYETVAKVL